MHQPIFIKRCCLIFCEKSKLPSSLHYAVRKIPTNVARDGELEKRGVRRGESRNGCLPPVGKFVRGEMRCIALSGTPVIQHANRHTLCQQYRTCVQPITSASLAAYCSASSARAEFLQRVRRLLTGGSLRPGARAKAPTASHHYSKTGFHLKPRQRSGDILRFF